MEHLNGILFVDIETVSITAQYDDLSEGMKAEWNRKAKTQKPTANGHTEPEYLYIDRAGIFSEFAKVVCISFGSIYQSDNRQLIRLKSLAGDNEHKILTDFANIVGKMAATYKDVRFCGHNIKEFDIPFLCRRMVINNVALPASMQLSGKKPWEINHIDTLELWKFGDNKNFTSLSLLAQILGIPSPKNDIDGSKVGEVYWQDKDLARISMYCMQDVLTAAKVYLRLKGWPYDELTPEYVD